MFLNPEFRDLVQSLEMIFYSYLLMYAVNGTAVLILLFYFEFRIMYEII